MNPPFNQVRISPDGAAIAWHRPEVEGDDAQPWLVVEEDPMYGVMHQWDTDERVADWPTLAPVGEESTRIMAAARSRRDGQDTTSRPVPTGDGSDDHES